MSPKNASTPTPPHPHFIMVIHRGRNKDFFQTGFFENSNQCRKNYERTEYHQLGGPGAISPHPHPHPHPVGFWAEPQNFLILKVFILKWLFGTILINFARNLRTQNDNNSWKNSTFKYFIQIDQQNYFWRQEKGILRMGYDTWKNLCSHLQQKC